MLAQTQLPDSIPTLWVVIGGCVILLLVGVTFILLYAAERRWSLLKRLRITNLFRQLEPIRPYANQILALDRYRRQAKTVKREASRYAPKSTQRKFKQQTTRVRKQAGTATQEVKSSFDQTSEEAAGPVTAAPETATSARATAVPASVPQRRQTTVRVSPSAEVAVGRLPATATPGAQFEAQIPAGQQIDRYQVDAYIGQSGTGSVYQAFDTTLAQKVTMKVIHPSLANQAGFHDRLAAAMQVVAQLNHPSIATVRRFNRVGRVYVVRAFVPGPSLDVYIKHQRTQNEFISLNETLRLIAQAAEALAYSHRRGLIHGRIHPGNILLTPIDQPDREGDPPLRAILTDFALTRLLTGVSLPESVMAPMFPYMSPEQCLGRPLDSRSDIYSLGILLYELAAGSRPFDIYTLNEARAKHTAETPQVPSLVRPVLPESVDTIILKAIAKNPDDRYQTGEEMAEALRQVVVMPTDIESVYDQTASPATALSGDQIAITAEGEPDRAYTMDERLVKIGAAEDNDIVLPGRGVAKYHARLEQSDAGWQVIDLGSLNGTFIESVQLLPDLPEAWEQSQPLKIGPYTLTWSRTASTREAGVLSTAVIPSSVVSAVRAATSADTPSPASEVAVRATIEPESIELIPGNRADVQVTLANRGTHVDHFHLRLEGIPSEWATISENDLQLMPGGQGFILLTLHPPRESEAVAGRYAFQVLVSSRYAPAAQAAVSGTLTVRPFEALYIDMQPERLRNQGTVEILLRNNSNRTLTCTLQGRDPADALQFDLEQPRIQLDPNMEVVLPMRVDPGPRPILGTATHYPFELQVVTETKEAPEIKRGQLELRPLLPIWSLAVISMMALICCIGTVFATSFIRNRNQANETATAVAAVAATETATAAVTPTITQTVGIPQASPTPIPYPSSCSMVKALNPEAVDGEYNIYLSGNANTPFILYCHNMASAPADYLPLARSGNGFNYSMISYPEGALVTHYQRLRINPSTLIIDRTDKTFATILGSLEGYIAITIDASANYAVLDSDFGVATGCNRGNELSPPGQANIDLTDTPFSLDAEIAFVPQGGDVQEPVSTVSEDGKIVNLSINGRCGTIQPAAPLQLIYTQP